MQYIIDIVLAAVFVLSIFIAAKKGFFVTLFELAAHIVSLVFAKLVSTSLAPGVFEQYFSEGIKARLSANLGDVGVKDYAAQIESALNSIPESLDGVMQMIGIDKESLLTRISQSDMSGKNVVENVMDKLVTPVGVALLQTIIFVILVIALTLILRLVVRLLDSIIKKLPAIKQVNSSLGAVLGAVKGVLLVIVIALLIGVIASVTSSQSFIDCVNNSLIVNSIKGFLTSISGYTF
ncbi:MAG: CvpA family protein [Faecalibacterium sp.]|nr:CvpA family protein [Ruminococcus sp.]MCM1392638.1 CvpA family protein [Ruminococcus sp.]MCM1486357.1 CvpA family protein [Faecalibacterium sp.]